MKRVYAISANVALVLLILTGKLYLGYDRTALKKLEREPEGIIRKADVNWNRRTELASR